MRDDRERLKDILHAIGSIQEYYSADKYDHEEPFRYGMVKYLEIVGEASRKLSQDTRDRGLDIPWKLIIGFRNIVVHQYHEMDWDTIKSIIEDRIPELKQQKEDLLRL